MTRRNLGLIIGQSRTFSGVLRDDNGDPVDLTPYTMTWKMGDKDFLRSSVELTEGNGITKVDATRGKWRINLDRDDTIEEARGLYFHQGFARNGNENLLFTFGNVTLGSEIR